MLQQTRCPAATRSFHLSSPQSSHMLTNRTDKKAKQKRALTPTYLRCQAADGMIAFFFFPFILFIYFPCVHFKTAEAVSAKCGTASQEVLLGLSVELQLEKEMQPRYFFPHSFRRRANVL